jgi:uncharacterized integral membrane protein
MMRLLILLLVLGVGILFYLQNQQLVTLVFFGNLASITLPIAIWVLLFIAAGALTSIFWQIGFGRQRSSSPRSYESKRSRSYSPPPTSPPSNPQPTSTYRPPLETAAPANQPDWESKKDFQEEWDDWEVQKPKREPVREFVREFPRDSEPIDEETTDSIDRQLEEGRSTVFEAEQKPQQVNRTGSVYSYVYREPKDTPDKEPEPEKEQPKRDRVYDADYRVIRPPNRENIEQKRQEDENDEDWL